MGLPCVGWLIWKIFLFSENDILTKPYGGLLGK
jgi:hypothetical protein